MNDKDKKELEERRRQEERDAILDESMEYTDSSVDSLEEWARPSVEDFNDRSYRKERRWTAIQRTGIIAALTAAAIAISGNIGKAVHFVLRLIKAYLHG